MQHLIGLLATIQHDQMREVNNFLKKSCLHFEDIACTYLASLSVWEFALQYFESGL